MRLVQIVEMLLKIWLQSEGQTSKIVLVFVQGEQLSVITALTEKGIYRVKFVRGTVNGDEFFDFIERDFANTCLLME